MKLFSVIFNYSGSLQSGVYSTKELALAACEEWMMDAALEWDAEENTSIAITRSFKVEEVDANNFKARCEYACFECDVSVVTLNQLI